MESRGWDEFSVQRRSAGSPVLWISLAYGEDTIQVP